MPEILKLHLNGQPKEFAGLMPAAPLDSVIAALDLKPDRIAVELNGEIVRRAAWSQTPVPDGARLEIVHFVGGG